MVDSPEQRLKDLVGAVQNYATFILQFAQGDKDAPPIPVWLACFLLEMCEPMTAEEFSAKYPGAKELRVRRNYLERVVDEWIKERNQTEEAPDG